MNKKIKAVILDKNKNHYFKIKSGIIWAEVEGGAFPICYITKPKKLNQELFDKFLDSIDSLIIKNSFFENED